MISIDVDFEAYKALTVRRASESVTYNDVVRGLLGLKKAPQKAQPQAGGQTYKGVFFPDGTEFRANHKGRRYTAAIRSGVWVDNDGTPRTSPSDAAKNITKTNINGWRFWKCKRPGETGWRLMDELRPKLTIDDFMV